MKEFDLVRDLIFFHGKLDRDIKFLKNTKWSIFIRFKSEEAKIAFCELAIERGVSFYITPRF